MRVDKNPDFFFFFVVHFMWRCLLIGAFLAEDRITESLRHHKVFGHQTLSFRR